ncbi:MAG: helix-turn-helix domain-containing protein [Chloroflexi bacterium]|nr:helix-turn-helix domain-containing protein [Chloroflexota bacterium]
MVEPNNNLTLQEAARELGRSLEQVRRYVREGKLSARKIGMQWFVERRALEAFKGVSGKTSWKDVLARSKALRESIKRRHGMFDVDELLEESRRGHP